MYLLIGFIIGFILPFQTSMNTRLRQFTKHALLSSFFAFFIGIFPSIILTIMSGESLFLPLNIVLTHPFYVFMGSVLGVCYVCGTIIVVSKIGITQTSILPIVGQMATGLLIDQFGLFHSPQQSITWVKFIGIIILMAGIIGVVLTSTNEEQQHRSVLKYQLLAILIGALNAAQTAINGRLGVLLQSTTQTTLYNFIIGSVIIALIVLFMKIPIQFSKAELKIAPFWMWCGALVGVTYVIGAVTISPIIGTGMTIVTTLVGLSAGSLFLSHFGVLNNPKAPITLPQLLCLGCAILGVVIMQLM